LFTCTILYYIYVFISFSFSSPKDCNSIAWFCFRIERAMWNSFHNLGLGSDLRFVEFERGTYRLLVIFQFYLPTKNT